MMWFWDQYTHNPGERNEITASPLRASREQLRDSRRRSLLQPKQTCCATKVRPMLTNFVRLVSA